MHITKSLPAVSFSGNLEEIILSATPSEVVTTRLMVENEILLEESYNPDANGEIHLRYKEIIHRILTLFIPDFSSTLFDQTKACIDFKVKLSSSNGQTDLVQFRVLKGQVDSDLLETNSFLKTNFLTWQPQKKFVQYYDPEWLTYYAESDCYLQVQAVCYPSKITVTKTIASLPEGKLSSINLNYGLILALFAAEGIPSYYDVYIEKAGVRLTYVQRYVLSQEEFEFNDAFVFENSLGGIDTIRFTGRSIHKPNYEFEKAWFDELSIEYSVLPDYVVEKNTGYFRTNDEKIWSADFFGSLQKYKVDKGNMLRIYTMDPDLASIKGELTDYSFNYSYSNKNDSMNLSRTYEAPVALALPNDVIAPVVGLAPRINHYPWATTNDVLFPVQYPYESKWRKLSLKAVVASILVGSDDPSNPGNAGGGGGSALLFGKWTDVDVKHNSIVEEDQSIQFKTDCPTSLTQPITYLIGQFFIDDSFIGTEILLGLLPSGNRPAKTLIKYFITANREMFLSVDPNGEVKISAKDGFTLPTGTGLENKYFINTFYKPSQAVQISFNGKWIIDPSASYCEPATSFCVWGKIYEENLEVLGDTTYADIIIKTFKGSADAPPLDESQPIECTNPAMRIGYYIDGGFGTIYSEFINNAQTKQTFRPGGNIGNPKHPKQIIQNGTVLQYYTWEGTAKDSWKLLQVVPNSGNTGKQINPKLIRVSDDADEFPLDINDDYCSVTGLPQNKMDNPSTSANYKVLNLGACPLPLPVGQGPGVDYYLIIVDDRLGRVYAKLTDSVGTAKVLTQDISFDYTLGVRTGSGGVIPSSGIGSLASGNSESNLAFYNYPDDTISFKGISNVQPGTIDGHNIIV